MYEGLQQGCINIPGISGAVKRLRPPARETPANHAGVEPDSGGGRGQVCEAAGAAAFIRETPAAVPSSP